MLAKSMVAYHHFEKIPFLPSLWFKSMVAKEQIVACYYFKKKTVLFLPAIIFKKKSIVGKQKVW
jgi:hypothetical protein